MSVPRTYQALPPKVDAMQFAESSDAEDIANWIGALSFEVYSNGNATIHPPGAAIDLTPTSWLVKKGGNYEVVSDAVFHTCYELAATPE